jgi:lipid-A-disaccharide synthase
MSLYPTTATPVAVSQSLLSGLSISQPLRIGIVAGEASGDILGASLIEALKRIAPSAEFCGVGGPRMIAAGLQTLYDMERLAVMGLVEPLKRLPELLHMRSGLRRHLLEWRADLVIGIDAPDFNLGLELWLREHGIRTAHFVSPSVWAWRQGRIHKIKRAVDLMLTLFPFEEQFYRDHGVPVVCVGHPLADQLPLDVDVAGARAQLGIDGDAQVVAVLPGSRGSEVATMGPVFVATMQWLCRHQPQLRFLVPAANAMRREQLQQLLQLAPELPVTLLDGQSQTAMAAADVVLMTSGTTALEALLVKKPMVVAYRLGVISYAILSRLVKTPFIALPNLLAGRELVPECLQQRATAEVLGPLLLERLQNPALRAELEQEFLAIHQLLRRDAGERAAQALLELIAAK